MTNGVSQSDHIIEINLQCETSEIVFSSYFHSIIRTSLVIYFHFISNCSCKMAVVNITIEEFVVRTIVLGNFNDLIFSGSGTLF